MHLQNKRKHKSITLNHRSPEQNDSKTKSEPNQSKKIFFSERLSSHQLQTKNRWESLHQRDIKKFNYSTVRAEDISQGDTASLPRAITSRNCARTPGWEPGEPPGAADQDRHFNRELMSDFKQVSKYSATSRYFFLLRQPWSFLEQLIQVCFNLYFCLIWRQNYFHNVASARFLWSHCVLLLYSSKKFAEFHNKQKWNRKRHKDDNLGRLTW